MGVSRASLYNKHILFFFSFQILSNLLEIVKDRAETAEDELDRIITEINESQDSPVSSEKSLSIANPSVRVSDGSDEVFDGSSSEKSQSTVVWEVRSHLTGAKQFIYLSLLPNNEILALTKLKAIADDKFNVAQIVISFFDRAENIVGKEENAGCRHFLLFLQCFQKLCVSRSLKVVIVW